MNISKMNVRITFETNAVETDEIGNHKTVWKDHFSCWATVIFANGTEQTTAGTVNAVSTVDFTVRWCEALDGLDADKVRIRLGNDLYNVTAVDPMNYYHRSLKFKCEKVKR